MKVKNLSIRKVLTTNAQKTIEVELETTKGSVRASVPIGTSRSMYEVVYLPVDTVIKNFIKTKKYFFDKEFEDQKDVDDFIRIIDKTQELKEIGGNLALAISSAFLKAFALEVGQELFEYVATYTKEKMNIPKPICNIIGGGKHAGRVDIQEFHFLPVLQDSFLDSAIKIASAYRVIGKKLKEEDPTFVFAKNLESAWTTNLPLGKILNLMRKVADEYELKLGMDFAASNLWDGNRYYVYRYSNELLSKQEQIAFVNDLANKFPIEFIEDPLEENDFSGFAVLAHELQKKIVCGDDIYSTNLKRLKDGLEFKATNAVLIKPNQIGTITDVIEFVKLAKKNKIITVMSHRSGETEDTLICHLAIGLGCDYIKLGISGERAAKINEMTRIEEKLKERENG